MQNLSLSEIAKAVGGVAEGKATVSGVFTDSRSPIKNGLFIALSGDKFDGHDFVPSLENTGIAAVLLERDLSTSLPKILVKDTRQALLDLAKYERLKYDIPMIGLTGSVGKTTTKEMIAMVLSTAFSTLKTEGNLNNDIGMPLTLLRLNESFEAAVIEMGMNHSGEISRLTSVCRPNIGVITKIGVNHIENLGSQENICKAKLEILDGMEDGSPLVVNGDDSFLGNFESKNHPVFRFGIDSNRNDVYAREIELSENSIHFTAFCQNEKASVSLPCAGKHNVYNALAALAVAHLMKIPLEKAAKALEDYSPSGMRQKVFVKDGITWIEDCYNASPDSMEAALKVLSAYHGGRKIAILGDMLELGGFAEALHRRVGKAVAENQVSLLYTYGPLSEYIADEAKRLHVEVESFREPEALADAVRPLLKTGDVVLVKGSRGMKMEKIIKKIFDEDD